VSDSRRRIHVAAAACLDASPAKHLNQVFIGFFSGFTLVKARANG
jgi:hypothetical protein